MSEAETLLVYAALALLEADEKVDIAHRKLLVGYKGNSEWQAAVNNFITACRIFRLKRKLK